MSKLKWVAGAVLASGVLLAGLATAFVAGYARGHPDFEPRQFAQRALARIRDTVAVEDDGGGPVQVRHPSVFLALTSDALTVPTDSGRAGGGLTSLGPDVLLLTAEGTLFAVTAKDELIRLGVQVPDNGHRAYAKAAESQRYAHLTFDLTHPRYNDILHYESELGRGLLISYTEYFADEACYVTSVAALELGSDITAAADIEAGAEDWRILYRTQPCLPLKEHQYALEGDLAGGRMVFSPPSTVYLTSGDYRFDGLLTHPAASQRPDWDYGKVIRLDAFSGEARVFSSGHRNPQGIAFDRNGQLWVVEHGPAGGDELNRLVAGEDYGWPRETLGTLYSGLAFPNTLSHGRHDNFAAPTYAWLPSIAPSSLELVDGFHATWDGDLLVGTLRGQRLYRLRIIDGIVQYAEPIDIGRRIRDILQHTDGRLVLWTDASELMLMSFEEGRRELLYLERRVLPRYEETLESRAREALETCMQCHALAAGMHLDAPSLADVYGEPIAGTNFDGYSQALRARGGRWTREALLAYLDDPQIFAPGTTMPATGQVDPAVLEVLVDVLEALKEPADFPPQ